MPATAATTTGRQTPSARRPDAYHLSSPASASRDGGTPGVVVCIFVHIVGAVVGMFVGVLLAKVMTMILDRSLLAGALVLAGAWALCIGVLGGVLTWAILNFDDHR